MRKTMTFVIAALLAAMTFTLSTPASAIDKAGALKLCGQNRNCGVNDGGSGWVDLYIIQSDGHTDYVQCPPKGECDCISCTPPKRTGGTTGKPSVAGVLRGLSVSVSSPNGPAPKTIPGPGLLETGSGFNSNAPAGAGSPGGGGAPSAPKGPVFQ